MTRALLDTDMLSEVMKGRDHRVLERARAYVAAEGRFTVSTITLMEITHGFQRVGRHERQTAFEQFALGCEILPFDDRAALLAGRIAAELERRGTPVDTGDVMIAAIAASTGLGIVTGNVTHFVAIRDSGTPLPIENWRDAR
jgi:predicted nucleic acid-binding protein